MAINNIQRMLCLCETGSLSQTEIRSRLYLIYLLLSTQQSYLSTHWFLAHKRYGGQEGKCVVVYHRPTCQRNQSNFLQVTDPIYNTKFNIVRMVKKIRNLALSTLLLTAIEFYRLQIQLCNSRSWLEIFIHQKKLPVFVSDQ